MHAVPPKLVPCPRCRTPVAIGQIAADGTTKCQRCGATVRFSPADVPPPAADPAISQPLGDVPSQLLGLLEELLLKMIRGVFEFMLIRVPLEIYRALVRWFPWTIRLIKVICLFVVWSLLVFTPVGISVLVDLYPHLLDYLLDYLPSRIVLSYQRHQTTWDNLFFAYTCLAIVGSIWGAVYIKLRRRKLAFAEAARPPLP